MPITSVLLTTIGRCKNEKWVEEFMLITWQYSALCEMGGWLAAATVQFHLGIRIHLCSATAEFSSGGHHPHLQAAYSFKGVGGRNRVHASWPTVWPRINWVPNHKIRIAPVHRFPGRSLAILPLPFALYARRAGRANIVFAPANITRRVCLHGIKNSLVHSSFHFCVS